MKKNQDSNSCEARECECVEGYKKGDSSISTPDLITLLQMDPYWPSRSLKRHNDNVGLFNILSEEQHYLIRFHLSLVKKPGRGTFLRHYLEAYSLSLEEEKWISDFFNSQKESLSKALSL